MPAKFSLQPVLEYRHNRVEALEVELGQIIANQQREEAFLERLHTFLSSLFAELRRQHVGPGAAASAGGEELDLQAVSQLSANVKIVEDRIRQQHLQLAELERQAAAKRAEVVNSRQEEETLVKLKEGEVERYRVEAARRESRQQDDIYIAQAYRKMVSYG